MRATGATNNALDNFRESIQKENIPSSLCAANKLMNEGAGG